MPEIKEVLVTAQLSEQGTKTLDAALAPAVIHRCRPDDREAIAKVIDRVDAAILAGDADDQILSGKNLKWIHCSQAGVEKSSRPEVFERGIVLTCSAGRSAAALAEHVVALMLSVTYDMHLLVQSQKDHYWCAPEFGKRKAMTGKTVGIIGMGNTGKALVKLLKAFDMRILSWRREPEAQEGVDCVYSAASGDKLETMLGQCDYVVLCCGLNDETWHMINADTLRAMRPSAFLINIGRGGLVDEPAMVEALRTGVIAGAGLDNFAVEPLQKDSPLWDLPNVVMTPHATPSVQNSEPKALSYVLDNIKAHRAGNGYVNQMTARDVFTHR